MFTLCEIVKIVNGKLIRGKKQRFYNDFSIDSRNIQKGALFLAIEGSNNDGHDFILESIKNGCRGLIIGKNKVDTSLVPGGIDIVEVDDTINALQQLAKYNRIKNSKTTLIAITGSNGKTTVKNLISNLLKTKFKVLSTEANLNNHIGVPLTLLKLNNHDVCILEMGMNHKGEIKKLSDISLPDIAVITNIGSAHIGNLGSIENILNAKLEIVSSLNREGVLLVNSSNYYLKDINIPKIRCETFGFNIGDTIFAYDVNLSLKKFKVRNYDDEFCLERIGEAEILNATLLLRFCEYFKIDKKKVIDIINNQKDSMRLEEIKLENNICIINDAYNSNLESVGRGLDYIDDLPYEHKLVALGDMMELGNYSEYYHREVGKLISRYKLEQVFLIGRDIGHAAKEISNINVTYNDEVNKKIIQNIKNFLKPNTLIYFKASRGMEFEKLIDLVTKKE